MRPNWRHFSASSHPDWTWQRPMPRQCKGPTSWPIGFGVKPRAWQPEPVSWPNATPWTGSLPAWPRRLRQTQEEQAEHKRQWLAAWQPAGIGPLGPREMRSWLAQHRVLVEQAEALRKQRSAIEQLQARIRTHRDELVRRLVELGDKDFPGESLAALLGRCQGLVEHLEALRTQRRELEKDVAQLGKRLAAAKSRAERAAAEQGQWRNRWGLALEPLGLGADATPAEANEIAGQLGEMFARLREAETIRQRIEGIDQDADGFTRRVQALARQVDPELLALSVEQAAEQLTARLQKATIDREKQTSLQKQRDAQAKRQRRCA